MTRYTVTDSNSGEVHTNISEAEFAELINFYKSRGYDPSSHMRIQKISSGSIPLNASNVFTTLGNYNDTILD